MDVQARATYRIETFGGLSVAGGVGPLTGAATQRKTMLLLAVLAASGAQGISRERLLSLFWPESDAERARHALKQALHILRRDLREPELVVGTPILRLNPDVVTSDVQEFEQAIAARALERAVALYRGPFLDGLWPDGAPELERWIEGERARLARRCADALERLADSATADGRHAAAVGWWRRLASMDPLSSRVAVALMRAHAAAGDPEAALQHARVHETLVREELDAVPDAAVAALVAQLRASPRAAPRAAERGTTRPPATPVAPAGSAAPVADRQESAPPAVVADAPPPAPPGLRHRRMAMGIAAALVLVASSTFLARRAGGPASTRAAAAAPPRSVAVLPFVDMSAGGEDAYLGDGIADELIVALGRADGLSVAARTSSFALRDARLDARRIADTLGVAAVVEGSVRRAGDRLRVTAQLVDARSGYRLWSEEYDREVKDVFAVQGEIAGAIANALRLTLAGGEHAARTVNADAYDLLLRATYFRNQLTRDGIAKSIAYYDRAIALDTGFALAYAGKASAMGPLYYYQFDPREPGVRAMRATARHALALDDRLGEAHVAMGIVHFFYEWDWAASEREFRRATELNPGDAHAWHMLANWMRAMGRFDEAIAARQRSIALDPLNARNAIGLGRDYAAAGRLDLAAAAYRRGFDIDSMNPLLLGLGPDLPAGLGELYERQGRNAEAVDEYVHVAARRRATPDELRALRRAFADGGMRAFWQRWLRLEEREASGRPRPLRVAAIHARLGDADSSAVSLERAWAERDPGLVFLGVDPAWRDVRTQPRIASIRNRMKLP